MTMQRTPLLVSRLIGRGAILSPEEMVVTRTSTGTHRQNYAKTYRRAAQLAHALRRLGISEGDRIGSFMWNNARHLELYQAIPSMGAVLHTLNIRLGAEDLEYIINHANDRILIVDADLLALIEPLSKRLPKVEHYIVCAEPGQRGDWETSLTPAVDYEVLIEGESTEYLWPTNFDENAPLGLCYTSGTTGHPKGVMYTHRSTYLHTLTQSITDVMSLSATDCVCGIVPMFHAMGWGMPFASSMLGAKQVMPNRFMTPEDLLWLLVEEKVTVSAGVPTIWQGVQNLIETHPEQYDLSCLDRLICGGSAPPLSMMRWYWETLGVEMIQGWGMTEINPLGTISRKVAKHSHHKLTEDEQFTNIAKAGLPMPGLELSVVDENFNPIPHDGVSIGELLIRGPWVCAEYYNNPQPDKFHDDWLVTGDIAAIDEENYLMIADRSKDLVKSGGEWISSVDLENHIVAREDVAQAAVVAQPHPRWGERPVAVVVMNEGREINAATIIAHCAERFAKWQLPDDLLVWDAIPLTSTGKMDKKAVRARLLEESYLLPELRGRSAH